MRNPDGKNHDPNLYCVSSSTPATHAEREGGRAGSNPHTCLITTTCGVGWVVERRGSRGRHNFAIPSIFISVSNSIDIKPALWTVIHCFGFDGNTHKHPQKIVRGRKNCSCHSPSSRKLCPSIPCTLDDKPPTWTFSGRTFILDHRMGVLIAVPTH